MIDFDPKWRTSTVVGICERIRATHDYSALPILADACQDAGCDDGPLLRLLRGGMDGLPAIKLVAMIQSEEHAASVKWLQLYAERMNRYEDAEQAFATLIEGLKSKELFAHGSDLHGLYELDDAEDLKEHAEKFLGVDVNWGEFSFSCSC